MQYCAVQQSRNWLFYILGRRFETWRTWLRYSQRIRYGSTGSRDKPTRVCWPYQGWTRLSPQGTARPVLCKPFGCARCYCRCVYHELYGRSRAVVTPSFGAESGEYG
jgi:hypothetical protein